MGIVEEGPAGPRGAARPGDPERPIEAPIPLCPEGDELGPRMLRRLTAGELEATIRAALELDAEAWPGPTTPPDAASADGFTGDASRLRVHETYAGGLLETAREVARIASSEPALSRLAPCAATGDEACARTYVGAIGRRFYRRSLAPHELERYLAAYRAIAPAHGFASWARVATIALVQSPHVVWRSELGAPDGALEGWEIAGQLAYAYSGAPPDAALLDRAERGELSDPEARRAIARGMILDDAGAIRPAFRRVALRFFDQWLGLSALATASKDPVLYPDYTPEVRAALRTEIDTWIERSALHGSVADLLTSPTTYVDDGLARYYGLPTSGAVERPEGRGVGLLAMGAWLSIQANAQITSPTRRGHFVRSRLLCEEIPPPPPTVGPLPEVTPGSVSTRQRYEMLHASRSDCASCHHRMDPIGFALEHLDAAGRWREREGAFDIDDTGTLAGTSRGDLALAGPESLAAELASLPEVSACVSSWITRGTTALPRASSACTGASARARLEGGGTLIDHWIALAASPHLARRRP